MIDAPTRLPQHLPDKLTICLWDFSWYTQAGPGQPYADLERAMQETRARGYNAIRICAAPMLLFSTQATAVQELVGGFRGDGAVVAHVGGGAARTALRCAGHRP